MCGIATISIGNSARGRIPYNKLRELVGELMWELQPRGMDASGIAVINEPGSEESVVFKKPLRPHRFIKRPAFNETLRRIGPHTNFIMLHARAKSVGGTSNNFNNHPIIIPGCIGIHNGTLYNHNKLFDLFSGEFEQAGDVDSEIILQLFKHYSDGGLSAEGAIAATTKQLWGAFTGAVVDWEHPRRMIMFKNDRPLGVIKIPHYDMIIAISEPKFYTRAIKRLKMNPKSTCEYVYDGTGFTIDLNTEGRITENIVDYDLPVLADQQGQARNGWFSHWQG